ncbi:unnamed protein product [Closterium sp. NIES-64]|nr:unnamed protein product [Closterium sp. NIES-64]CAI6001382.1 unnamed protein product [Closterium sp. NIES-65]CAI6001392.1 unnamed protein product [Closterium sp. NIES-65]
MARVHEISLSRVRLLSFATLLTLLVASTQGRPLAVSHGRLAMEQTDSQAAFPGIEQVLALNGADEGFISADPVARIDRTDADDVVKRLGDPEMSKVTRWVMDLLRETSQEIAAGAYEKAAKKLFSPRTIVMPPEGPSLFLLSSFQKAAFLQSLSLTLPNVEFQPDGISIYDLKYKTYKKYGMTITGTYVTSPSPLVPAATPDNGKFIFYWDLLKEKQVGAADVAQFPLEGDEGTNALRAVVEGASTNAVTSNGKYIWGVSWMVWNSDLPKDAPDEPSENVATTFPEAAGAATAVRWFDQLQEQGAAEANANAVPAILGDPRPQDIIMQIQAAWEGFSAAIATGDAVSATAIFAPVVILLPPNQPRTMLVTPDQKQRFAQDLIDAQVALSVTVEDVVLVELKASTDPIMAGGSSSLAALVRSSYSKTTQSGHVVEMGKRVDLWQRNPMFPGQWYFVYSIWNSDGLVAPTLG